MVKKIHISLNNYKKNIVKKRKDRSNYIRQIIFREFDSEGYEWDSHRLIRQTKNYKINLKTYKSMTDPMALFRPQLLTSWYGLVDYLPTREIYYVFFIEGTDEGITPGFVDVLINKSKAKIKKEITDDRTYDCISDIIHPDYI